MVLEGLYKSKVQDSVQLYTVFALYDQETVRNNVQPSGQEYLRDDKKDADDPLADLPPWLKVFTDNLKVTDIACTCTQFLGFRLGTKLRRMLQNQKYKSLL